MTYLIPSNVFEQCQAQIKQPKVIAIHCLLGQLQGHKSKSMITAFNKPATELKKIDDFMLQAEKDFEQLLKGNHIIRTMEALRNILIRSGGHHVKKRYTFRPLSIATRFMTR